MKCWFKIAKTQSFAYLLSFPIFSMSSVLNSAESKKLNTGGAEIVVKTFHSPIPEICCH